MMKWMAWMWTGVMVFEIAVDCLFYYLNERLPQTFIITPMCLIMMAASWIIHWRDIRRVK